MSPKNETQRATIKDPEPGARPFLSREGCKALFERMLGMTSGGGQTAIQLVNRSTGTTKWLRNRVVLGADTQTGFLTLFRTIRDAPGMAETTRLDDAGLREAVQAAEWNRSFLEEAPLEIVDPFPFVEDPMAQPVLWSEPTYSLTPAARTELVQQMTAETEAAGLFAAGTLAISGGGHAAIKTEGVFRYYPVTAVECAMTVRDAAGTASGWAGVTHHDLSKIDPAAISARALDKCRRSVNPRAIEPGRYTVILEPQAVHDLFAPLIQYAMDRGSAPAGNHPFHGRSAESASKIGSQVLDRRLMVSADPMDPDAGFLPFDLEGTPFRAVTWIDRGILKELAYGKGYALRQMGETSALPNSGSFRLQAAPDVPLTSIDEMIASTKRGIVVTRFSEVKLQHFKSMLCAGYTRDGLWLVENGKITMPIKNFRFTDSPLFALNSVEAIGPTARVFSPGYARIAPALKVREFSFTSLADAV